MLWSVSVWNTVLIHDSLRPLVKERCPAPCARTRQGGLIGTGEVASAGDRHISLITIHTATESLLYHMYLYLCGITRGMRPLLPMRTRVGGHMQNTRDRVFI